MRLPALLLALLAAGCAQTAAPPAPSGSAGASAGPSANPNLSLSASGDFAPDATQAIVYDRKLAPEGSRASLLVESEMEAGKTRSSLVVEGFLPGRTYGAHLHTSPCGAQPDDSGPHYQNRPGKVSAKNEIWLDFTTDGTGSANASARNPWLLASDRLPRSLVIHAERTKAKKPERGDAGPRVACLTLS
ncbi:superoxide dismutase family protein [Nonomuraea muscovyensis]|uniref:Cu-Zn family superoxide dismutase n=1 Tax=Nonomuraea muscovyensis TaxID=1124761 RepID=A0A7X0F2Y4_9ACTN|nr:superoxide dismutase family protein [Nonomuraea muscovyensis]MBB6351335.1 Cu-Zn family superoxide dismutase [Nonomuraea muscovyensis]